MSYIMNCGIVSRSILSGVVSMVIGFLIHVVFCVMPSHVVLHNLTSQVRVWQPFSCFKLLSQSTVSQTKWLNFDPTNLDRWWSKQAEGVRL